MKRKISILYILSICLIVTSVSLTHAIGTPTDEIRSTIDAILDTLKDKNLALAENKTKRRETIFSLVHERFDFEEMSKRSLAQHWKKRTPEEKKEFVSLFSQLIENSYVNKLESYTDEKVTYTKETIKGGGKYGVVSTSILTKDVAIPIDYKVIRKGDKWWVYDVLIEGVSFITNYRSQYNKIIRRNSYSGLVEELKKKIHKLSQEESAQES
jgi:phospholipid transport system substrate-binding protein